MQRPEGAWALSPDDVFAPLRMAQAGRPHGTGCRSARVLPYNEDRVSPDALEKSLLVGNV